MKAASSEWYSTTARHVLPLPSSTSLPSSLSSRANQSQRLLHGSPSRSSYGSQHHTSSLNTNTSGTNSTSNTSTSTSKTRSVSFHSTGSTSNSTTTANTSIPPITRKDRKPYSFSKSSKSSQSRSNSVTPSISGTTTRTLSKEKTTSKSLGSINSRQFPSTTTTSSKEIFSDASSFDKYKRSTSPLYPLGISSSFLTSSSFLPISEAEVSHSETETAFTEEEDEEESGNTSQPADEASTTEAEEEEDDDQVYSSFKNTLRMLRVQHTRELARSISPALSLRSIVTELEEDEEELPPEEVDDELQTTTEEEEEEDEEDARSFSHSSKVPKSPVKVRVKVEKASSSDHDSDRVKVTVQLESEETELSDGEEEEEESSEEEDTENTAETVKYGRRKMGDSMMRTEDDEDESDDYGEEDETSESGQSDTELLSEVTGDEAVSRKLFEKTDSRILITPTAMLGNPHRIISSLGDMPSRVRSGRTHSPAGRRSQTIHEIQRKRYSERNKSDFSLASYDVAASTSKVATAATSRSGAETTQAATSNSTYSPSETSSRSQSARLSLTGRASATHKMYSVGTKLRSLSARRSALPPPLPPSTVLSSMGRAAPLISPILSTESSNNSSSTNKNSTSTSSSSKDQLTNPSDAHSSTHYIMTKFASLAPPPSVPFVLPEVRSHSAKAITRRQLQLRQLSHGNMGRNVAEDMLGLPPITQPSISSASSLTKPRPLLRNDTYTVFPIKEIVGPSPFSKPEFLNPCVAEHMAMHQIMLSEMSATSSTSVKSVPRPLPYDKFMTTALSFRRDPTVSFASFIQEHSLSTNHTQSSSHQLSQPSGSQSSSNNDENEEDYENEKAMKEERLLNKNVITLAELEQESGDEYEDEQRQIKKEKLKKFALSTIRMKMARERKRLETIEMESDGNGSLDDDDDEDEDESSEEESEEEAKTSESNKRPDGTNIPVPATTTTEGAGENLTEKTEDGGKSEGESLSQSHQEENNANDPNWSWKDDLQKRLEGDPIDSPIPSRPDSAESGYRALPPSRVSSAVGSRQQSTDSLELEREKDRLLSDWKKGGGTSAAGSPPKSAAGSDSRISKHGESDSIYLKELVHGEIDLNVELPGEEKKLAMIWEEFNRDERDAAAQADYEFSTLLDEMIQDVNNYKPRLSTSGINSNSPSQSLQVSNQGVPPREEPKFEENRKYQTFSELVSLLSYNIRLVSSETLEDHMASLISLISSLLRKVRKARSEEDYNTQIACLSAIRVLCDRIQEMHNSQNLKYADLSWLFRVLCKYSSDSDSKIRPEASFCLARLVKVAGPALVVRPIYFILVMESDGGHGKTTTGAKTKAAAIDTLTYALLTFPKEDFHNLEEVAGWVCLAMLNEERRIRQSALECLSIITNHLGGREKALPLFHTLFLREELDHFSRSPSPESTKTARSGKSHKTGKGSDSMPMSVHGTVRLLTGPGFPIAQPIDAITARLDKDVLPVPSTKGLIEYAVNVPTGKDLVLLMTHMLEKDDDEWDFSSSTDSLDSGSASAQSKRSSVSSIGFSDIDWTGEGKNNDKRNDSNELITADVAYILLGKGRVNKQEVVLLDTYKKEIIPEIINMLNKSKGKHKKKRYGKQKGRKQRRRRGQRRDRDQPRILDGDEEDGDNMRERRPPIPTLSFDFDDGEYTFNGSGENVEAGEGRSDNEEVFKGTENDVTSGEPSVEEPTQSQETEEATPTQSTST